MMGGYGTLLDKTKAWDAEGNFPPRWNCRVDMVGHAQEELVGDVKIFQCPTNPAHVGPDLPSSMHYLGIAGLGKTAADLPLSDPRAGFFGSDRQVSLRDLTGREANVMALAEAGDGGPWTAGGRATVRGLAVGGPPYLGEGGQFAANHWDTSGLAWSNTRATNALFADGSVRPIAASVSPQVFKAMATIAGGEARSLAQGER